MRTMKNAPRKAQLKIKMGAPVKKRDQKKSGGEKLPEEDSMQEPDDNIVQPHQACLSACMH